jgi:hypothetical protein
MTKPDGWSVAGHTALGIMCVVWLCAGWAILFGGGFHSTPRHTHDTAYVDGPGAVLMAFLFFALAAIGTAVIMRHLNALRAVSAAVPAAMLGLPAAYLVVSAFG